MVIKSLIVVIGILFFLSLEYLFPKEKIEFKDKLSRIFKNIFFWLVNIGITPIIILPITIYATQFELHGFFKDIIVWEEISLVSTPPLTIAPSKSE